MAGDKFIEIRPYNDVEAIEALQRVSKHPLLSNISTFLFPDKESSFLSSMVSNITGVYDFQHRVMLYAIRKILSDTSTGLSYSGLENLNRDKRYLFISNHRDIMLDSAILQVILVETGMNTSEMAVGDNLITDPLLEDIARVNKMIKVVRTSNPREIYNSSILLSEFIRKRVVNEESSVWIAQRNGRTKDGLDYTEQGLLKMLDMSGSGDFVEDFCNLSIVPVSVSYEYEPCDILKARELFISKRQKYIKSEGEDLNSILTGITQFKGGIHFHFNNELEYSELMQCSEMEKNDRFKALGDIIDNKIINNYKLWSNNYIAYDLKSGKDGYSENYTNDDKLKFEEYISSKLSDNKENTTECRELLLNIYSNPVVNKEKNT